MLRTSQYTRERNWFSNRRQAGIVEYLFPTHYERCEPDSPRLFPLGKNPRNKLGIVGLHQKYRKEILHDLNKKLEDTNYCLKEIDIRVIQRF
jgi:hypothetical protein